MPAKEYQILPMSNTTNVKSGKSTHWKFDICHLTLDIPCFSRAGFTLVELMVVISIIAILASIGLVIYSQAQQSARDAKRIADMGESQKALEQFYAINRNYVSQNDVAISALTVSASGDLSTYFQNNTPPNDPNPALVNSFNYKYYSCNTPATQYIVCARLENCGSRCNMAAVPGDGCGATGAPAPSNVYFCLKSLSN